MVTIGLKIEAKGLQKRPLTLIVINKERKGEGLGGTKGAREKDKSF